MPSMTTVVCKCGCGKSKEVRTADVKRGWGKYYSKSCKAKHQAKSCGGRKYSLQTILDAYNSGKVSAEYLMFIVNKHYPDSSRRVYEETGLDLYDFDEHPFSSEALGQW